MARPQAGSAGTRRAGNDGATDSPRQLGRTRDPGGAAMAIEMPGIHDEAEFGARVRPVGLIAVLGFVADNAAR